MSNRLFRISVLGLLSVIAIGVVAWAGAATASPQQQGLTTPTPSQAPTSDIGVTGTGRVFAKPDTALATVGVEITATTLASASADASTRMTAVIDKIKSLGVDDKDIKTVGYNVNPLTSQQKEGEPPRITGYQVVNLVQIKIRKLDDVGKILDSALTAGANSMNGLTYTIDDPTTQEQQARTQAVQAAMAKAQTLADAAKVKLGPIISITENVSRPIPIFERAFAAAPAAVQNSIGPVQAGQNEIEVTVEMHFQIAQ